MVRVTAYGQDGPYRDRPGFARIAHAFSGLSYLSGEAGRVPVVPGSTSLADYITGLYAALGALIALMGRGALGKGQVVDIGLYEGRVPDARRDARRLREDRLRARAHGRGHRQRRAAQPLPHARRRLDRDRLHHREDVGAADAGHGPARPADRPRLRDDAAAPAATRRRQRDRGRTSRRRWTAHRSSSTCSGTTCRPARSTASPTSSRTRSSRRGRT